MKQFILKSRTPLVIFVDYPGMNLRLMQSLKKAGCPSQFWHFIAPTAWAWKISRVNTLKTYCDHLFCILPFEEAFFKSFGIKTTYVGHPLMHKLKDVFNQRKIEKNLLAIFPGSRVHEIEKNLPRILESLEPVVKANPSLQIGLSIARSELRRTIEETLENSSLNAKIQWYGPEASLALMLSAERAIAKSGTCNLELALLGTPSVIVYAVSKLDLWIAQKVFHIHLPFYSLPNILLNRAMFQELYGPYFTSHNLTAAVCNLKGQEKQIEKDTQTLRHLLGEQDAGVSLAEMILKHLGVKDSTESYQKSPDRSI